MLPGEPVSQLAALHGDGASPASRRQAVVVLKPGLAGCPSHSDITLEPDGQLLVVHTQRQEESKNSVFFSHGMWLTPSPGNVGGRSIC